MTYIDYIKNFWLQHNAYSLTVTETALYFYLLETNNLCKWANTFNRNNSKVLADLGIASLKTLSAARNRLKQVGLIDFKTKNGSPVVTYSLVKFTEVRAQVDTEVRAQLRAQVDTELNKTKTKNNNNPGGLFAPAPAREEKPKPSRKKPEIIIPTLEEVKNYFSGKLPDWEMQAETFFYHFDSLGWKNANGARIERWDSRANLWITEKIMQNGNRTSKSNDGGHIPVANRYGGGEASGNILDLPPDEFEELVNSIPIGQ